MNLATIGRCGEAVVWTIDTSNLYLAGNVSASMLVTLDAVTAGCDCGMDYGKFSRPRIEHRPLVLMRC